MRRIYSHPDLAVVHLVKNELEHRGISAAIRGEHLAAVAGGGAAATDAWPGLWLADDARLSEALDVIREAVETDATGDGEPWTCPNCGEEAGPAFAACWACGSERPEADVA